MPMLVPLLLSAEDHVRDEITSTNGICKEFLFGKNRIIFEHFGLLWIRLKVPLNNYCSFMADFDWDYGKDYSSYHCCMIRTIVKLFCIGDRYDHYQKEPSP